ADKHDRQECVLHRRQAERLDPPTQEFTWRNTEGIAQALKRSQCRIVRGSACDGLDCIFTHRSAACELAIAESTTSTALVQIQAFSEPDMDMSFHAGLRIDNTELPGILNRRSSGASVRLPLPRVRLFDSGTPS